MTVRAALVSGVAALVAVSLFVGNAQTSSAGTLSQRPFAATSFWNAPLPDSTPLDPNSASYVANITAQVAEYYGHAAVNTTSYTAPVYTVPAGTPTVAVKYSNCQNKSWVNPAFAAQMSAVPIPANAKPSLGTDGEMIVWQPSTDQEWELWEASQQPDGWYACWGGRITNASTSDGVFAQNFGVAASGLSLLGGEMRVDELQAGSINHAIEFGLPNVRQSTYSWPANRTDGNVASATAIPEGQRFRLDPNLNVDALNISPMAKMVAKAMQKYGAVVSDRSGAVSLYAEDAQPYIDSTGVDPYAAIFGSVTQSKVMNNFPWSSLQALPFNYGAPGQSAASSTAATTVASPTTTVKPTTTTAKPTTTTAIPTTTTTIATRTTNAWTYSSTVNPVTGGVVQATYTAPSPTSGSMLLDLEVHNPANQKVAQAYVTQTMTSGTQTTVKLNLPASLPPGTYAIHQGVFLANWSTLVNWKMTGTFIIK